MEGLQGTSIDLLLALPRGFVNPASRTESLRASPFPIFRGGGSGFRDRLSKWMPRNVTINPAMSDIVFVASVVLNPWKRIKDAAIVHVENPT